MSGWFDDVWEHHNPSPLKKQNRLLKGGWAFFETEWRDHLSFGGVGRLLRRSLSLLFVTAVTADSLAPI